MMFQTLHILLLLTAVAMVTERATAACLKYELRQFQNTYNLMQSMTSVGCCDTWVTKWNKWGEQIIKDGWLIRNRPQAGADVCKRIDNCGHTLDITHQVVNGTAWSSGWADTYYHGMVIFGATIGDINNRNLKVCSDLKRIETSHKYWGNRLPGYAYIMPDVDLTIIVNDVDPGKKNGNNFVTYFKARIHPMRFVSGKKRLCLYANFRVANFRLTFEPEKGCPQAPFWIAIDFEMEFTEEEKRKAHNQFSVYSESTTGPYCSIVHDNQTFGCMLDPCTGCEGLINPCTNDEHRCCVNNSCYKNPRNHKIETRN